MSIVFQSDREDDYDDGQQFESAIVRDDKFIYTYIGR